MAISTLLSQETHSHTAAITSDDARVRFPVPAPQEIIRSALTGHNDDGSVVLNMGPHHPSTHGVLLSLIHI